MATITSAPADSIEEYIAGYEIVEFYKVTDQAYAMIYRDKTKLVYMPIEPILVNDEARKLVEIKELLPRIFTPDPYLLKTRPETVEKQLEESYKQLLSLLNIKLDETAYQKILYYLKRDFIGYGPIEVMYNDAKIEDITCAGVGSPVYVFHREYEWLPTTVRFDDAEQLSNFARKLAYRAGQDLVYSNPIVEGPLPPKRYRVHLTLDIVSWRGTSFTIRRSSEEPYTITQLVKFGSLTPRMAAYLWMLISHTMTMLIAGPMASGKTTLLNAIAMLIPPQKKIVTIEETSEIRLMHENWTPMIVRPSMEEGIRDITLFELLKSSLRQRPDYIIVGEIRGEEAYTFFQAISVGHGGLGTIHGESYDQVIKRLENPPMNIPRTMIPLVNSIILLNRIREDSFFSRKVVEIMDILGYEIGRDAINATPAFRYDIATKKWIAAEYPQGLRLLSQKTGMSEIDLREELRRREAIIRWMVKERIFSHQEVSKITEEYYYNPEATYDKARAAGVR